MENSLAQHKTDSEVWVPDYLTPSWVSLPDDRPVLAIIQPGETAMEALEALCRVNVMYTKLFKSNTFHCDCLNPVKLKFR